MNMSQPCLLVEMSERSVFYFIFLSIFYFYSFFVLPIAVFLAIFGRSFGIRRVYVRLLQKIFRRCNAANIQSDLLNPYGSAMILHQSGKLRKSRIIQCEVCQELPPTPRQSTGTVWTVFREDLDFVKAGIEVIIEDEVTDSFLPEPLPYWNLLARTSCHFQPLNWKMKVVWLIGFVIRYFIFLPARFVTFLSGYAWLLSGTAAISLVKDGPIKRWLHWHVVVIGYRINALALAATITYHNSENRPTPGGICVTNHTSPMDALTLSCDTCYALTGQKQSGLLGITQRAMGSAANQIWFERNKAKDRNVVIKCLRAHTLDKTKLPILMFPEGTCVNNTSIMMFRKGSFEVGAKIYPVAIRYDPIFGDLYYNSNEFGWFEHIIRIMTSWALVADVWYLPPMEQRPSESAIEFAERVKNVIAEAGGFVNLDWDAQLKRNPVPGNMVLKQQELYWKRFKKIVGETHFDDSGTESDMRMREKFQIKHTIELI